MRTTLRNSTVKQDEEMTTLPTAPATICGVINLRSRAIPIIDLAVQFGVE